MVVQNVESLIPQFPKARDFKDIMHLLSMEEAHILKRVDGQSSVAQLATALQQDSEGVLEILKALSSRGLVLLAYRKNGKQHYLHTASSTADSETETGTAPVALGRFKLAKKAIKRSELASNGDNSPKIRSTSKQNSPQKAIGIARMASNDSLQQASMANVLADLYDSIDSVEAFDAADADNHSHDTSTSLTDNAFAFSEPSHVSTSSQAVPDVLRTDNTFAFSETPQRNESEYATREDSVSSVELAAVLLEREQEPDTSEASRASSPSVANIETDPSPTDSEAAPTKKKRARFQKVKSYQEISQANLPSLPTEPVIPEPDPLELQTFTEELDDDDLTMFLDEVLSDPEIPGSGILEVGPLEEIDAENFRPEMESLEEIAIDSVLLDTVRDIEAGTEDDMRPAPEPAYNLTMLTGMFEKEPEGTERSAAQNRAQAVLTDDDYFDDLMNNPPPEIAAIMDEAETISHPPSERAQAVLMDDDYFDDLMNNPPPEIAAIMDETETAPNTKEVFLDDVHFTELEKNPPLDSISEVDLADVYYESGSMEATEAPEIEDSLLDALDDIDATTASPHSQEKENDPLANVGRTPDMSKEGRMARILNQVSPSTTTLPNHVMEAIEREYSNTLDAFLQFFDSEQVPYLHAHARTAMVAMHPDLSVYTQHLKKASSALSVNLLLCMSLMDKPEASEILIKHISNSEPVIQTAMLEIADILFSQANPKSRNTIRSRIRDLLNSEEREDRERGYVWLEKSQDSKWVSLALKLLSDEAPYSLDELERIALLSSRLNPTKTLPVLEKLAEPPGRFSMERSPRKDRRFAAITALTELADPKTEPILRKLIERSQGELKERCITAMQEIRRQQSSR